MSVRPSAWAALWYLLTVGIIIGGMFLLSLGALLAGAWEPLVYIPLLVLGLWFVLSSPAEVRAAGCPHCGGRLNPVRSPYGVRLWTCSACGWERRRERSRAELRARAT